MPKTKLFGDEPNLIKDREARTVARKIRKSEWDSMIQLSANNSTGVRLLDEGMVVMANGAPDFYIKKGVIQDYYDNLDDGYVGSINLGHLPFANFPFLLGTWTKKDLTVVDIGNGRKGLNVDLHLDEDSFIVKELRRMPYDVALSVEMYVTHDYAMSEEYGVDVVEAINITDFGIVGEPGNVNSAGLRLALKGENMTIEELTSAIEDAESKNLGLDAVNALLDEAETAEEPEQLESTEPEAAAAEEEVELDIEEEEETTDLNAALEELSRTVQELQDEVQTLRDERDNLQTQLSAQREAEKNFLARFKNLTIALTKEDKGSKTIEIPKADKVYTDGFGE